LNESPNSRLDIWRSRLGASAAPVFAKTVRQVSQVVSSDETSVKDLSEVVGQDASMTARLIRIANSSLFNPQSRSVDSIGSAVYMLGFDAVRELSVSLALIDQVLKGRPHTRVTQSLARAFHAAAQARSFARLQKDKCPEEVFVAALLYEVGELTFWSADAKESDEIDRLMRSGMDAANAADAEQKVLGFSLRSLSRALADDWCLGSLLKDALDGKLTRDGRVSNIALGHSIAQAIEEHGIESPASKALLKRLCAHLDQPMSTIEKLVSGNLQDALRVARSYGVETIERVLPMTEPVELTGDLMGSTATQLTTPARQADQMKALLALAASLEAGAGLDQLFRLLLEGVHTSIGFDRTYFALFTSDRKALQAKYALGRNAQAFSGSRRSLLVANDFFQILFETGRAGRYHPGERNAKLHGVDWLASHECLCMPIALNGKPVGVLYGDRSTSLVPITDDEVAVFRLFGLQIPLVLTLARRAI